MQVQAQTADVATFCLGERVHPSLCHDTAQAEMPCRRRQNVSFVIVRFVFADS